MKCTQVKESKPWEKLIFADLKNGQWFMWEDTPSPCIKIKDELYFNVRTAHSGSYSTKSAGRVLLVDGDIFWHATDEE